MSISDFLKQKRMAKSLSQKELAERTGINISGIKQYETGRSMPTVEKAAVLAQVLDFDAADLFREVLEPGSVTAANDDHEDGTIDIDDQIDLPLSALKRLRAQVENRGHFSRFLVHLSAEVEDELETVPLERLLDLSNEVGLPLGQLTAGWRLNDLGSKDLAVACEQLQSWLIVHQIFGQDFWQMSNRHLRHLHEGIAKKLGQEFPISGVAYRSGLSELFSGKQENAQHRIEVLRTLPGAMVSAVKSSHLFSWELDEEGDLIVT